MSAADVRPPEHRKDRTLWKQGAGVGAVVGGGFALCLALGMVWELFPPPYSLLHVAGQAAMTLAGGVAGAVFGAIFGWAVPVWETTYE
ncbi:MAG: hypothetical protein MUF18_21020, partial [Fimbriiglobus sp.]|nr:hypothetical protein [Fimbriiglobus sp.]